MRIDHSARQPPPTSPTVFVPSVDNMWTSYAEPPVDEEYNPDSYAGEWIEMRDGQQEDTEYREDLDRESTGYLLSCGSAEEGELYEHDEPYYVSPLPSYPPIRNSHAPRRRTRKSNGCGSVVHINAIPRRRCGVWMAKDGGTDAIVGMDSSYFDRAAVTRMMKSTCGCVREGIGCSVW